MLESSSSKEQQSVLFSYEFLKDIGDRCLAFMAIAGLAPLLAMIALVIRIDSPSNPIFTQERVGKDGRKFMVHKFRTMYADNDDSEFRKHVEKAILQNAPYRVDADGNVIYKFVDDPRVTRFGALLRKTNLDELPQLINILKGEMSFIGPRPEMTFSVNLYKDWHKQRLSVKPGITGLWQAYGRGYVSFDDMVRFDIDYIKRRSMLLDLKIALRTIFTVIGGKGSY